MSKNIVRHAIRSLLVIAVVFGALFVGAPSASASTTCDTHYTFGSGANAFNLCLSNDGNLVGFESPAGSEHIGVGTIWEGYAVCSGASTVVYGYDAGFDESGWGPSTVQHPSIKTQTWPIIVTRTTTDNSFQLVQTFAINANHQGQSPEREVTIAMKLTNISAATINDVYLTRYVDFDVDSTEADDIYSISRDAIIAQQGVQQSPGVWRDDNTHHAIELTVLNFATVRNTEIHKASDFATNHNVCDPGTSEVGPTVPAGDFVGRVVIHLGNMAAGASKTINLVYRRI